MSALIYKYFEESDNKQTYVCKLCKKAGINKTIKSNTTSNLLSHLQTKYHEKEYAIYLDQVVKQKENDSQFSTPRSTKKRKLFDSPLTNISKSTDICINGSKTNSPKYNYNSFRQRER